MKTHTHIQIEREKKEAKLRRRERCSKRGREYERERQTEKVRGLELLLFHTFSHLYSDRKWQQSTTSISQSINIVNKVILIVEFAESGISNNYINILKLQISRFKL